MSKTNGTNGDKDGSGVLGNFFKEDLGASPLLKTKWDEAASADSLDAVYEHVMSQTNKSISWYLKAKRVKRFCARSIRIYAIVGGAVAAALPTVADMLPQPLTYQGISIKSGGISALILGTIAALLLLDRFFGISSGWVRFTRTQLQIRQIAQEFQIDWEVERAALRNQPPQPHQISKMLARCKAFVIQVNTIVREETDAWIQEFQEALRLIDESSKPKAAATEPGALNLTIAGGDQSTKGWKLSVDDNPPEHHQGSQVGIVGILPGKRLIKVEGEVGGQLVKDEKVINVPAGGICAEALKLT